MDVIILVGKVCSGKTTYMKEAPEQFMTIDVGDIVRKLMGTDERKQIPNLDRAIIDTLQVYLEKGKGDNIPMIIGGIRQMSIIRGIFAMVAALDINPIIVHLDVPDDILRSRYQKRAAEKDLKQTFDEAVTRDNQLGYEEMIGTLLKNHNVKTIPNFTQNELYNYTV